MRSSETLSSVSRMHDNASSNHASLRFASPDFSSIYFFDKLFLRVTKCTFECRSNSDGIHLIWKKFFLRKQLNKLTFNEISITLVFWVVENLNFRALSKHNLHN